MKTSKPMPAGSAPAACLLLAGVLLLASAQAHAQVVQIDPDTGAFTSQTQSESTASASSTPAPPAAEQTLAVAPEALEFESPIAGGGVGVSVPGGFLHFMKTAPAAEGARTLSKGATKVSPGATRATTSSVTASCKPRQGLRVRAGVCTADLRAGREGD